MGRPIGAKGGGRSVRKEAEGAAVERGGAVLGDGGAVLAGGISGVARPAILRMLPVEVGHVVVAVGFGQNGGGGDGEVAGVALDEGGVRQGLGEEGEVGAVEGGTGAVGVEAVAVDDDKLGAHFEAVEGAVHGQNGGVEDVDFVDFPRRHHPHRPGQRIALHLPSQGVTAGGGELFGVVERRVAVVGRQDDGGGIDRTGQTTAAGFVATGFEQAVGVVEGKERHGLRR